MDERARRAVARLNDALNLLSCIDITGDTRSIPVRIGDASDAFTLDFSATALDALADAVVSLNDCVISEAAENLDTEHDAAVQAAEAAGDNDQGLPERAWTEPPARTEGRHREAPETGEWSAAAVAKSHTDLWDQVNNAYDEIPVRTIRHQVMNDAIAPPDNVAQALDEVYGDSIPYADEDIAEEPDGNAGP